MAANSNNAHKPLVDFQNLNAEQRQVLGRYKKEAFFYRALPFSAASIFTTRFLMQRGIISSATPLWKYSVAGFFGYIIGMMSYSKKCMEELKRLNTNTDNLEETGEFKMPELENENSKMEIKPVATTKKWDDVRHKYHPNRTQTQPVAKVVEDDAKEVVKREVKREQFTSQEPKNAKRNAYGDIIE